MTWFASEYSACSPGEGTPSMLGDMDVPTFWPFFDILGIEHDLFGVLLLIHQHQNDILGTKTTNPYRIRSLWSQIIFSLDRLGPIFSGKRHTPIGFHYKT